MNLERVKKVKRSKPITVLDGVLSVLLICVIALCAWLIFRRPATVVKVYTNDREITLPLDKNTELVLDGLTVHVENGYVWVTDADCGDKTCEHTGKISRAGQSIVCLPNGIIVSISGESDLQWEIG